jgi:CubicO group peptidase (beta-lactamase class C family)
MMHIARLTIILMAPLLVLSLAPLMTSAQGDSVPWPTEGWETSTPEEQGMDTERLAEMIDYLQEQHGFDIHSLTIIRNGYVVTDAYFYPFAEGSLHDLASVTKSFTSTLVGIAIDQSYIESVRQPVLELFPERTVANVDANKEAMTVEDLLTMSSGLACIPEGGEPTLREMRGSLDWPQFTLDLPMATEPGTRWVYCSPNPHLLSAIIRETSGMSALDFAQEYLFTPLGISEVIWPTDRQGNNRGWGDLILSPHDMAKLGYLYLHQGEWDGQQVLSADWVTAATSPVTGSFGSPGYGYLWWLNAYGSYYFAAGRGGQRIFVFPDQDIVVVTTGGGGGDQYDVLETLLTFYILPAAESETPLPPNPDGVAALAAKVQEAAAPVHVQPEPVAPMPEIARQVSGQMIIMDANRVGVQSISLDFSEEAEAVLSLTFVGDSHIEWRIGLDNVWRFSPGIFGLLTAAEGSWISDNVFTAAKGSWIYDNVFVFETEEIGDWGRNRYRLTFEDDRVTIQIQNLNGYDPTLILDGRLEE